MSHHCADTAEIFRICLLRAVKRRIHDRRCDIDRIHIRGITGIYRHRCHVLKTVPFHTVLQHIHPFFIIPAIEPPLCVIDRMSDQCCILRIHRMRLIRTDKIHHMIQFAPDRAFPFCTEPVAFIDHHFVLFRDLFRDLTYRFDCLLIIIPFRIFLSEFFSQDKFHSVQCIFVIGIQNRMAAVIFGKQIAYTAPISHQRNILPLLQMLFRKQRIDLCKLSRIPEIYTVRCIRRKSHRLKQSRHPDVRTDRIHLRSGFVLCRLHCNAPVFFHTVDQIQIRCLRNVDDHPGGCHASFFCLIGIHSAVAQCDAIIHRYRLSHPAADTDLFQFLSARIRKRLQPDTSRRRIVHIRIYGETEDRIRIPRFI